MKFLRKLLSSLVILAITATVSAYILSSTILNAHYIEASADNARLYDKMAQLLPATLISGDTPEALVARQALSDTISVTYIKNKFNPFIEALLAHYSAGGPAPRLDLSDLSTEITRQGFVVPEDSPLAKPINVADSPTAKTLFSWLAFVKIAGPLVGLASFALLMLLHKGWDRFKTAAKIFFAAAISEGLIFVLFRLAPGLMESLLFKQLKDNELVTVLTGFYKSLLAGVAGDFGMAAVGLALLGAIVIIAGLIFKAAGFVGRHAGDKHGSKDRYDRPNSDNRPMVN